MKQGGQPDVEDLDALIESRSLKPKQVRFGGREWTVSRDFPAEKMVEFWAIVDVDLNGAMAMLVGQDDAAAMTKIVKALPSELAFKPLRRLYQIAGLLTRTDDEDDSKGESSASSRES